MPATQWRQAFRVCVARVHNPSHIIPPFGPLSSISSEVDIDDLRANTVYSGGFRKDSKTVTMFWDVVRGFNEEDRRALLKFVTSCSRPPLQGFRHLHPAFTIHKARGSLRKEEAPVGLRGAMLDGRVQNAKLPPQLLTELACVSSSIARIVAVAQVDCEASPWAQFVGQDVERLPSASTCFCTLKLPNYRRAATMREKLMMAIKSGAGFDLS